MHVEGRLKRREVQLLARSAMQCGLSADRRVYGGEPNDAIGGSDGDP